MRRERRDVIFMMSNNCGKLTAILAVCFFGLFILGCVSQFAQQNVSANVTNVTNVTIANPASVFCIQQGGLSKIVTAADGSQMGICVFPDGSACEEWAYYRGECAPGANVTRNVTANISSLLESDFIVIDDSMPSLLTTQQPAGVPAEPQ